ncbi:hypothetical protein HYG81_22235 (plasmid) [Natrinema zhouii]|uniref:HalOD1 output domain-containing protein n=1 Tax=Natrinema zhouii TaxID=1710539 RepID=UPI001CFFE2CA|nr:HalOD1 output domain-containing protein [Natrinema zhouii]UHQ98689.1 hypothetical protein HYG81_22235 [Natrinema zhouii]
MESTLVGTEIVEQIAAREGVDPADLGVRLYDIIDSDALEALTNGTSVQQLQANLRVEFTYYGYVVPSTGAGGLSSTSSHRSENGRVIEERVSRRLIERNCGLWIHPLLDCMLLNPERLKV